MELGVLLLADVAVARLDELPELRLVDVLLVEIGRREDVRRREYRLLAQDPDPGPGDDARLALAAGRLLVAAQRLAPEAALDDVWVEHVRSSGHKLGPLHLGERAEEAAVAHDRVQELGRSPQLGSDVA